MEKEAAVRNLCRTTDQLKIINGVTSIAWDAFSGNRSTSIGGYDSEADIKVPNSISSMYGGNFPSMPNLEWVECWNGLTTITPLSFANCPKLKSIHIPKDVSSITTNYDSGVGGWQYMLVDSPNVTIYCEVTSKQSGWCNNWNAITLNATNLAPVVWGVSRETYRANNRYLNN